MNPIVKLLGEQLLKYVEAHPEVLQEVFAEGMQALISWIRSMHKPAPAQ
jgi:hypothetical protein